MGASVGSGAPPAVAQTPTHPPAPPPDCCSWAASCGAALAPPLAALLAPRPLHAQHQPHPPHPKHSPRNRRPQGITSPTHPTRPTPHNTRAHLEALEDDLGDPAHLGGGGAPDEPPQDGRLLLAVACGRQRSAARRTIWQRSGWALSRLLQTAPATHANPGSVYECPEAQSPKLYTLQEGRIGSGERCSQACGEMRCSKLPQQRASKWQGKMRWGSPPQAPYYY